MRIVIHNFGPIKEADIETKRYTVFIGQTSTGKSVAAKLISIANDSDFMMLKDGDYVGFCKLLARYCIDFVFYEDTEIRISNDQMSCVIRKDIITFDVKQGSPLSIFRYMEIENAEQFKNDFKEVFDDLFNGRENDIVKKFRNNLDEDTIQALDRWDKIDFNKLSSYQRNMVYLTIRHALLTANSPVYIPAERILISIFTNSIFSLLQSGPSIPESIKRFGSLYERAKAKEKQLNIDFMNIIVSFSKEQDTIHVGSDNIDIDFSQASSGMQSIIPMWSVFCNALDDLRPTIVIEEPELNLFPTLQVALVSKMVERMNSSRSNLVITTHSPYILSVFDNLIYAKDVYDRADDERKEKVAALVNPNAMISYDDIAAYNFDDHGVVTFINDSETRSTGAYALDAASNETANVFNELLAIDNEL
jgi:AAA15 family ATPase/GTPase